MQLTQAADWIGAHPWTVAAISLIALYVVLAILAGEWNIIRWAEGADGRISASKLQFLMWTILILFSYILIFAKVGGPGALSTIPVNVLIALGFSGITVTAAKGITVNKVQSGDVTKVPASVDVSASAGGTTVPTGLTAALRGDDGSPDLTKIQMIAWTLVAQGVYLYTLFSQLDSRKSLPDIDPSLMVLAGLSQGAYLGKKLVTNSAPRLFTLDPIKAAPGAGITLVGSGFGDSAAGNVLAMNGTPIPVTSWADERIVFTIPAVNPERRPGLDGIHDGVRGNRSRRCRPGFQYPEAGCDQAMMGTFVYVTAHGVCRGDRSFSTAPAGGAQPGG